MRKNVLQVIVSTGIGGAETVALNIGRNLDKNLFNVDFLAFTDRKTTLNCQIEKIGNLFSIDISLKKRK